MADGELSYEQCRLTGSLTVSLSGDVNRTYYTKFNEPAGESQCTESSSSTQCSEQCLAIALSRNAVDISGGPALPLNPPCQIECPLGGEFASISPLVLFPGGFTYDASIIGDQTVGDATVNVSYDGGPHIEYHRVWDHHDGLDFNRDVGEAHVTLERDDSAPPLP
jgi:hypothetical protein